MDYSLDPENLEALEFFSRTAEECGLLAQRRPLQFLGQDIPATRR